MENQDYIRLDSKIAVLTKRIGDLETKISSLQTVSDADAREAAIRSLMDEFETDMQDLSNKLAVVQLPDETKYFLSEAEINFIKTTIKEIKTLKAEVDQVLQTVISKVKYMQPV